LSRSWMGVRWIYGVGILVVFLGAYFIAERPPTQNAGSSEGSVSQQSAGGLVRQAPDASPGGHVVHSTDSHGAAVRPKSVVHGKDPSLRQFQMRSLSAAETDRLEALCSRQRQLRGQAAYQSCLKAQLDVITNPAGNPDLSALSQAERESIESVCSAERRRHGSGSYNRCETEQVATLAAEPARPDLSKLNDEDRHLVESTCTNVKNREGPAAYNRCLDRLMSTLTEAK
jgi:hypothetical protein